MKETSYQINNLPYLHKLLWIDFGAGASVGLIGMVFNRTISHLLGIPESFMFWVFVVNFLYSLVSLRLVSSKDISIPLLRGLIFANWAWAFLSIGFIYLHFQEATIFGKIFLLLNIPTVGGLAYLEGKQLERIAELS